MRKRVSGVIRPFMGSLQRKGPRLGSVQLEEGIEGTHSSPRKRAEVTFTKRDVMVSRSPDGPGGSAKGSGGACGSGKSAVIGPFTWKALTSALAAPLGLYPSSGNSPEAAKGVSADAFFRINERFYKNGNNLKSRH